MSNLTSITDARQKTTRFVIDDYNRVQTVCYHPGDPCTRYDHFTYDGRGQVGQKTDRRGVTTTYTYDGLGRLTGKSYSDGTSPAVFRYDEGAASQKGRLTSASAGGIDLAWVYNLVGDITEARKTKGQVVRTLAYEYEVDSKRRQMRLDNQLLASYYWEERRLPLSITREASQDRIYEFSHDPASRRKTLLFPNAVLTTYSYDERSRLRGIVAGGQSTVLDVTYPTHDLVGNRLSRGGSTLPGEVYHYDELYRLWYVTEGQPETERYTYDPVGNRLTSLQEPTPPWAYNDWNQLTSKPGATFDYDLNGNLWHRVEGGITWTYEWDAENRLKRVLKNGAPAGSYVYDALGRRAERLLPDSLHEYLYDGEDILVQTFTNQLSEGELTDVVEHVYTHGPGVDEPLEVEHGVGVVWNYHADGLGSIVRLTDAQQNVVWSHMRQYDSFGNPVTIADYEGYAFTGREFDAETGLYYYRARYYDPKIGRFISEDPIGFEGGVNFYAYVLNNPINLIDPSGLDGGSGMGWPGHRGPGPKPPTWYDTWSDWYQRGDQVGWRYAHCMASCETAGHSGQTTAKAAGYANEIRQTLRCWTFSPGDCASAWADQDFKDNETGYTCPANMSCEDRCRPLLGMNKTPPQFGPFFK